MRLSTLCSCPELSGRNQQIQVVGSNEVLRILKFKTHADRQVKILRHGYDCRGKRGFTVMIGAMLTCPKGKKSCSRFLRVQGLSSRPT